MSFNRDWLNGRGPIRKPEERPVARRTEGPEDWRRQLEALAGKTDHYSKKESARLRRLLERSNYPCATSRDTLVWALWHSYLKRNPVLWASATWRGVKHGLDWRNCPGCDSTLCKAVG